MAQSAVTDPGDGRVALSTRRTPQLELLFFTFRNAQVVFGSIAMLQNSQISMSAKSDGQQTRSDADAKPRACRRNDASDDR
jgi:hypothetical protein